MVNKVINTFQFFNAPKFGIFQLEYIWQPCCSGNRCKGPGEEEPKLVPLDAAYKSLRL
jgi:hypothetical protein